MNKWFTRRVCSGEKHKRQHRVEKKVKQEYGSSGFGVVPQGALGDKLYHKVDPIFRPRDHLVLVSH